MIVRLRLTKEAIETMLLELTNHGMTNIEISQLPNADLHVKMIEYSLSVSGFYIDSKFTINESDNSSGNYTLINKRDKK